MIKFLIIISTTLFLTADFSIPLRSQQPEISLDSLQFLTGSWTGKGTGEPGKGIGEFSFSYDLQNKVLVRKSYAEYPATNDKPAYRHDDLMVIYEESGKPLRAVYFDNEGHVINYSVNFSDDRLSLIFVSDNSGQSPGFRLTYTKVNNDTMNIKFEIASPGKQDDFKVYIEALAYKK
jgi:hypothetical protein